MTGDLASLCCSAPVRAVGDTTQHYVCSGCRKPCDWTTRQRAALDELAALTQEFGPDTAVVCITHGRFLPCRKVEGCVVSEDPEDVADVAAYHRDMPLARHDGHDPALPCRPALGAGLCYLAPAGVHLVPWREALGSEETG